MNRTNLHTNERPILTYDEFPYGIGNRIGQIYLSKVEDTDFIEVEEFEESTSDRIGGFGSTGK